MDEGGAPLLPDSLVYQIFLSLGPADVLAAGLVCRQWHAVSRDEFLWREQFYRYYQVARDVPRHPGQGLHVAPWSTRLAGRETGPFTCCHLDHMLPCGPSEATTLAPHRPDLHSGHQGTVWPAHGRGTASPSLSTEPGGGRCGGGSPAAEMTSVLQEQGWPPCSLGGWPLWERRLRAPAVTDPPPPAPSGHILV